MVTPWETVIESCPLTSLGLVEKLPCGNHAAGSNQRRHLGEQEPYDARSGYSTTNLFAFLPSAAMAGGGTILVELHPLYIFFVNTCTNQKTQRRTGWDGKGEKKKENGKSPCTYFCDFQGVCRQTDTCLRGCVGFSQTTVRPLRLRTVVRIIRHKRGDR